MNNRYATGQLARALTTANAHEDAATRQRADARVRAWHSVIEGMASGNVSVGARAPVRGLPVWVTPEVVRGGFATGRASARGPLEPDELARIANLGLPRSRGAVFASYLTDTGVDELGALIESRDYSVRLPEDAALLVVAALIRGHDRGGALDLLETLRPYAASLRFMPRGGHAATHPVGHVHRRSAVQVAQSLRAVTPDARVEAQREALSVWIPLTDQFVELWRPRAAAGNLPDWTPGQRADAKRQVAAYDAALRKHRRCGKYRNPKENLPILVAATRAAVAGHTDFQWLGRVRHVLGCVATKRGMPDSEAARALREVQTGVAVAPSHAALAQICAGRLSEHRVDEGIADVERLAAPVTREESEQGLVPFDEAMPPTVVRKVKLGLAAPIEELVAQRVIPSAEVLAELVPELTAHQVSLSFEDARMGALMGATYAAFRRRRSLLLVNLAKQVQFTELPWVSAAMVAGHDAVRPDEPARVARRLAALAIDSFPGTILPNPLISELSTLFAAAGIDVPLTEELAADIFMGRFSPRFLLAAQLAARTLQGSLYERYYGLDFAEILQLPPPPPRVGGFRGLFHRGAAPTVDLSFDDVCQRAAPAGRRWSVARNGMVIERQQLLTTHNLASLVGFGGVVPTKPWHTLALEAAGRSFQLLDLAQRQTRALATVKDAAYAWRQAVIYTSLAGTASQSGVLDDMQALPLAHVWPMSAVVDGLVRVARNEEAGDSGPPFMGWSVGRHWAVHASERR